MLLFYDCSSVTFNLPLIYTIFSLIHTSSVVFVLLYCSWLEFVQFYLGVVLISYFWYINTWIRYFITYCTSPFLVVLVDFTLINKIPTSFDFPLIPFIFLLPYILRIHIDMRFTQLLVIFMPSGICVCYLWEISIIS